MLITSPMSTLLRVRHWQGFITQYIKNVISEKLILQNSLEGPKQSSQFNNRGQFS